MMTFFPEHKRKPPDEQCMGWARLLMNAATGKHKAPKGRATVEGWARTLGALQKDHKPERVSKVLTWYCRHMSEDMVPVAFTAAGFVLKFSQIEKCMDRQEPSLEHTAQDVNLAARISQEYKFP